MKTLGILAAVLFLSTQAFAKKVECTLFALGAGTGNFSMHNSSVELSQSPSGESLLGTIVYEFPEAVPVSNDIDLDAKNVYKLEISLKHQNNTSKWLRGGASIKGSVTLTKEGKFLVYKEIDSNTLFNQSDKRRVDEGKIIGVNTVLLSPVAVQEIMGIYDQQIMVQGVELSVKDLVRELGVYHPLRSSASNHLAAQGKIRSDLMVGVQVNCSH